MSPSRPAGRPPNVFDDPDVASAYDARSAFMFEPSVIDPTVDVLAGLAGHRGRALELAVGTGRVALPLAERGVEVHGIELSEAMVAELRRKPGGDRIAVTVGDMATTQVGRDFPLAYLVFNTIGNLLTQDEQVQCFRSVAEQLAPGGFFVVECVVPPLRRFPPGSAGVAWHVGEQHLGVDTMDLATQRLVSHHYRHHADGSVTYVPSHHRCVWPSELDLMARLAGLRLRDRWSDWTRAPFTSDSESHVSVWVKPA